MNLEALGARVPALRSTWSGLKRRWRNMRPPGRGSRQARRFIVPEEFQEELIVLGLSGRTFGVEDYVAALSQFLGISISVHAIPDGEYPELTRRLALSGRLGEVRYSHDLGLATVFVPGSLPPLVFDLTVLHELGHLAAGDLLVGHGFGDETSEDEVELTAGEFSIVPVRQGKRLASGLPFAAEAAREHEANLRASYAFIAGCLGEESPYVHGMYEVL